MTDNHEAFVKRIARQDPESAIAVEKDLEKLDSATDGLRDDDLRKFKKVEDSARLEFARYVWRSGKRKAEGVFNFDTGKFEPTEREDIEWGKSGPWPGGAARAAGASRFSSWAHVYWLCMAVCRGEDVPEDIKSKYGAIYGRIHEQHMVAIVDARLKAENDAHEEAARLAKKSAEAAHAASREGRLEKRRDQLKNLQGILKKLMAREAAIRTRMRKVQASIRMLERVAKS